MAKTPTPPRIGVNLRAGVRRDIDALAGDRVSTTDLVNQSLSMYCFLQKYTRDGELTVTDPQSGKPVIVRFL